jgi:hypothetical protein
MPRRASRASRSPEQSGQLRAQPVRGFLRLDTLRHDVKADIATELDGRAHDDRGARVGLHPEHERPVDLDCVNRRFEA